MISDNEQQADEAIESAPHKHFLKPEQEVRNYFMALNFLEDKLKSREKFSLQMILDVQAIVEKGASKEKVGLRGPMPQGWGVGPVVPEVYQEFNDNSKIL